MKWCFLALLLLNLLVAAMQWVTMRAKAPPEVYVERPDVEVIQLRQEHEAQGSAAALGNTDQCLLLGPMPSQDAATYWHKQFQWAAISSETVVQAVQKAPSYMVYLGPMASQAEAVKLLQELQAQKIESFVIASGAFENGVSLGIYENIDLATVKKEEMSQRGFAAKVGEMERQKEAFWVFVSTPYVSENKKKIDNILAVNSKLPEMRQIFCKSIASKKLLP